MSLEQTIKDTLLAESADLDMRLQQLVRAGLMPANTIPLLRKGIAKVQGGYPLVGAERDVMANFLNAMMFIVLGDDVIFNKARTSARSYATEEKEKQEYDYEGDMAMSQLKSIIANSQKMHDMLSDDTNLPEWVQSKITLAEDYISTAANYMQGEMNEEKRGLWDNIHAKRKRIKAGSGERMRKPGSEGAPSDADLKNSRVNEGENKEMKDKDPCWKGYQMVGMKKKGGKEVPNCVPANEAVGDITVTKKSSADSYAQHTNQTKKTTSVPKDPKTGKTLYQKVTSEEIEQIDELSKGKLKSYLDKTKSQKTGENVANVNDKNSMRKYTNRVVGGVRASRKLLAKESRRSEALADIAAFTQMNESYKTTFNAALEQYGIKSPSELDEEKRKEFFNFVDQNYKKGDN